MKNNEATFFVFIAAIIIGVLISLNINFKSTPAKVQLDAKQYQEAINKRNNLYNDISKIKQKNDEISNKINGYNYANKKDEKIAKDIEIEAEKNKMIAGLTQVQGIGLKIVLSDAKEAFPGEIVDDEIQRFRLIHDMDMLFVINELKVAGAESISINNQRLVLDSEVECHGTFIKVNGKLLYQPFFVDVIGDSEIMKKTLLSNEGYLKILMNRGIGVDIEVSDKVDIPAYIEKKQKEWSYPLF